VVFEHRDNFTFSFCSWYGNCWWERFIEGWSNCVKLNIRGCIQKFPDWPPGARTANGTALCH
jgi:hypothetical protein